MKPSRRDVAIGVTALGLGIGLRTSPAAAQAWPSRPVRMIVAFPPGGSADVSARVLAEAMSDGLGQRVYVENVPGAGGNLGGNQAARAAPDGYTILFGLGSMITMNPHLYQPMPYDPLKDLMPLIQTIYGYFMLIANPKLEAKTTAELVALAKANPGKLKFASFGNGSGPHIAGEMFKRAAGVDMVHVPYRGGGPALNDVIAGHVDMIFDVTSVALPQVRAGTVRAFGVTAAKRLAAIPDIPTIAETLPGFLVDGWHGLFVANGTPKEISDKIQSVALKALQDAKVRQRLADFQFDIVGSGPDAFARMIKADHDRWGQIIRENGIKIGQ